MQVEDVSLENIVKICRTLDCDINDILEFVADNNNSTTNTSVNTSRTTKSPQTGDETNLALWIIIMIVSFGMLIFIIGGKKLKAKGLLSVVICCAILGMLYPSVSAEAASTQKSFTIAKEITVDGKNATISAKISYNETVSSFV